MSIIIGGWQELQRPSWGLRRTKPWCLMYTESARPWPTWSLSLVCQMQDLSDKKCKYHLLSWRHINLMDLTPQLDSPWTNTEDLDTCHSCVEVVNHWILLSMPFAPFNTFLLVQYSISHQLIIVAHSPYQVQTYSFITSHGIRLLQCVVQTLFLTGSNLSLRAW